MVNNNNNKRNCISIYSVNQKCDDLEVVFGVGIGI